MTRPSHTDSYMLKLPEDSATGISNAMLYSAAGVAEQPHDLFDEVIAFTFDVLGHQDAEQRRGQAGRPAYGGRSAGERRKRRG